MRAVYGNGAQFELRLPAALAEPCGTLGSMLFARRERSWLRPAVPLVLVLVLTGLCAGGSVRPPAAHADDGRLHEPAPSLREESQSLKYTVRAVGLAGDGVVQPPEPSKPPPEPPVPPPPPPVPVRPVSPAGLKLWSDGDSVSYFMTTNLFSILGARGAVPVRGADYKISSRLTHAAGSSAVLHVPFSDWFSYAAQEMAAFDPDIVVLMVGANDLGFTSAAQFGDDAGRMMDLLRRDGRMVAWVGLPAFGRADLARSAPAFDAAAQAAASTRDWVTFVNVANIVPDGDDGVHFSPGQARLLADAVVRALFPD